VHTLPIGLKLVQCSENITKTISLSPKPGNHSLELLEKLHISQSAFEKRFRKVVETIPKKFTSIIRFNAVLDSLNEAKSLTEICYEHHFFDQAHFIKDFSLFTDDMPGQFKRSL